VRLEIIHAEIEGKSIRLSLTLDEVLFSGVVHQVLIPLLEEEE
jgi:hypothetical protein